MADEEITSLDDVNYDASRRAEAVLDHILNPDGSSQESAVTENKIAVSEAIKAKPMLNSDTGRTRSRVLFVTTDESVLVADSIERQRYMNQAAFFDEVHVLCLVSRRGSEELERLGSNIWVYQVRSKYWWYLPWKSVEAALEALTWNGNFRPDIVVGVDPFEAGLAAYFLAKKFDRPWQLHVKTNPYTDDYKKAAEDNGWRIWMAAYVFRKAKSVRLSSGNIKEGLKRKLKKAKDVALLPRFFNFTALISAAPVFNLHEKYRDYSFILLTFGPLSADSYLHDVFSALNKMLHNPRIGLVVIGDGPGKGLFVEKVKLLGLEKNVVFLKEVDDLASFLKTADILVELSGSEEGEVRVLQAAAAGLPIVAKDTDLRRDLFKDGESAFLCQEKDLLGLSEKVGKLINNAPLRRRFSDVAQTIVSARLHEDPNAHYQALAETIEMTLRAEVKA